MRETKKLNHHPFKLKKLNNLQLIFPSLLLGTTLSVHAETIIPDSSSEVSYKDDSSYLIAAETELTTSNGSVSALTIQGLAGAELINHGSIYSPIGATAAGLTFSTTGSILNESEGTILGSDIGLYVDSNGAGAVNLTNKGDISAAGGLHSIYYVGTGGTIDNYGTIGKNSPTNADGIYVTGTDSTKKLTIINEKGALITTGATTDNTTTAIEIGAGAYVDVTNKGDISSSQCGICAFSGTGAVVNIVNESTGVVSSGSENGTGFSNSAVYLQSDSSLNNVGKISSATASAIDIENSNNTIINTGTILGGDDNHTAIYLKGDNNTVTLGTGSHLSSDNVKSAAIQSAGNNNTLTLTGEGSEAGSINGVSRITSDAGSKWSWNGDVVLNGSTTDALTVNGELTLNGALDQTSLGGTEVNNGGTLIVGDGTTDSASLKGGDIAISRGGDIERCWQY